MFRRFTFVKYVSICIILVTANSITYGQVKNLNSSRPNVLFIIVDDLSPRLRCYGDTQIVSPNIDRLAATGQVFTQAYATFPNCGPSRASILSGLYTSRSRWIEWNTSQDEAVPGIVSLPMYFKNNGYKTISLGKVYNNFGDGKGSWNEAWQPPVTTTPWDYQSETSIKIFKERNKNKTRTWTDNDLPKRGPAYEKPDVKDNVYMDGRIAIHTVETLQEFAHSPEPFFLAVGFHKPHLPFNSPLGYWKMYDKKDIQLPANRHKPKGAPDISMTHRSELNAFYGIPQKGLLPDSLVRTLIHGYDAAVSYVDNQIGRVLSALNRLGLDKNTIVVLIGDHGFSLGEHGLWGKHFNYSVATHIPLIIKAPGNKKGNVRQDGLVSTVDIYPTLCDLAGLPEPFHLQGQSFAKRLDHPEMPGNKAVFWRANTGRGETILTQQYSYTEYFDDHGKQIARMLYDLQKDPHENDNVAENPEYVRVINELSDQLNEHIKDRDIIHLK